MERKWGGWKVRNQADVQQHIGNTRVHTQGGRGGSPGWVPSFSQSADLAQGMVEGWVHEAALQQRVGNGTQRLLRRRRGRRGRRLLLLLGLLLLLLLLLLRRRRLLLCLRGGGRDAGVRRARCESHTFTRKWQL